MRILWHAGERQRGRRQRERDGGLHRNLVRREVHATRRRDAMFHGRVAARRAPARAIRLQRRTFLGGALEIDHEAILAAKKRRRLRSFVLGALQPRDTDLAAIRAAEDALAGFAPSGVFSKKATLEAAVGEAESVLLALPELSQLKLDLMSFELEKPEDRSSSFSKTDPVLFLGIDGLRKV